MPTRCPPHAKVFAECTQEAKIVTSVLEKFEMRLNTPIRTKTPQEGDAVAAAAASSLSCSDGVYKPASSLILSRAMGAPGRHMSSCVILDEETLNAMRSEESAKMRATRRKTLAEKIRVLIMRLRITPHSP